MQLADTMLDAIPDHVAPDSVVDFDMYDLPQVEGGFHAAWKTLQAPGIPDLVWTPRQGGHWIATNGQMINAMYADYERFSNRVILVPKSVGELHKLLPTTIDPPAHRPYRMLLNSSLAPKAVGRVEAQIAELAAGLIEGFKPNGGCEFTTDFAEILPIHIFMRLFGLPIEDAHKTKYWADQMIRPDGSMSFEDATQAFFDYIEPHIEARIGEEGGDMLSALVNGRIGDRALNRREALELSVQILIAGIDTVVNFLSFAFLFLAESPDHRRQLRDDPALIPAAVDELFRRFPVVSVGREVRQDIVYEGTALKQGDIVILPTPLHGMDERANPDALTVDFGRPHAEHTTFGNGPHRCPGAHLARTEMRIAIAEWLARIPDFTVDPAERITYRGGIVGVVNRLPLVW